MKSQDSRNRMIENYISGPKQKSVNKTDEAMGTSEKVKHKYKHQA
jgi:hypothetical protein